MGKQDDLTPEAIEMMGQEELDSLDPEELEQPEVPEEGAIQDETGEKPGEGQEAQESAEEPGEGGPGEEEEEGAEAAAEEQGETGASGEEITHDPLKDTQRAFHRKAQEVKRLQEENEKLRKKLLELEEKTLETFEELTPEELEELKADDPDAYIEYMDRKRRFEQWKAQREEERQRLAAQRTYQNILEFVRSDVGLDPEKEPEKVREYLQSEDFQKIDRFVTEHFKPHEDGSYSIEDIRAAYYFLFKDKILQDTKVNTRVQAVEDIRRAAKGGSPLDRAPKERSHTPKRIEDYTPDEIAAMSAEQLAELERQLEETM